MGWDGNRNSAGNSQAEPQKCGRNLSVSSSEGDCGKEEKTDPGPENK